MKVVANDVAQFILQHYPRARKAWEFPKLVQWVNWHMGNDTCLMVADEDGLCGVALVRTVFDAPKHADDLEFDPEGDTYFIDACVLKKAKRKLLSALIIATLQRFGERPKTAFQWHGNGQVIVVDTKEHLEKFRKFPLEYSDKEPPSVPTIST